MRFDVYAYPAGAGLLLDCQADLLASLGTGLVSARWHRFVSSLRGPQVRGNPERPGITPWIASLRSQ